MADKGVSYLQQEHDVEGGKEHLEEEHREQRGGDRGQKRAIYRFHLVLTLVTLVPFPTRRADQPDARRTTKSPTPRPAAMSFHFSLLRLVNFARVSNFQIQFPKNTLVVCFPASCSLVLAFCSPASAIFLLGRERGEGNGNWEM